MVVITVAGEALVDLIEQPDGRLLVMPGGGPMNAARMVARLGGECRFLGRVSEDAFGDRIAAVLAADGVALAVPERVAAPTTVAVSTVDAAGVASYRFYLDGTSAGRVAPEDLPADDVADTDALVLGGLALTMEPICTTLLHVVLRLPERTLFLLDPNCRAQVIADAEAYRARLGAFLRRADVVKLSDADLHLLHPGLTTAAAAEAVLASGPRAVLVTRGEEPVWILHPAFRDEVPVPRVAVVDTVGAGDAVAAAFVTWWRSHGRGRDDVDDRGAMRAAVEAAVTIAAAVCTRAGAEPVVVPGWADTVAASEADSAH